MSFQLGRVSTYKVLWSKTELGPQEWRWYCEGGEKYYRGNKFGYQHKVVLRAWHTFHKDNWTITLGKRKQARCRRLNARIGTSRAKKGGGWRQTPPWSKHTLYVVRAIISGSHVRSWRRMRGRQEITLWASEPEQRGSEEPTLRARAAGGKELVTL